MAVVCTFPPHEGPNVHAVLKEIGLPFCARVLYAPDMPLQNRWLMGLFFHRQLGAPKTDDNGNVMLQSFLSKLFEKEVG